MLHWIRMSYAWCRWLHLVAACTKHIWQASTPEITLTPSFNFARSPSAKWETYYSVEGGAKTLRVANQCGLKNSFFFFLLCNWVKMWSWGPEAILEVVKWSSNKIKDSQSRLLDRLPFPLCGYWLSYHDSCIFKQYLILFHKPCKHPHMYLQCIQVNPQSILVINRTIAHYRLSCPLNEWVWFVLMLALQVPGSSDQEVKS